MKQFALILLAFQLESPRTGEMRGVVEETGKIEDSRNSTWWVSSGAYYFLRPGFSETIQGRLEEFNRWRLLYSRNNPRDTDDGYHPQNIFRLVNRGSFENFIQEVYFEVTASNLSESENRNGSNGILLFNRYQDANNLYYTGLRVDGHPVIKKKFAGIYYTLAYPAQIFEGKYDRIGSPNLLPEKKWIGMRSILETEEDGSVSIRLYVDMGADGNWQLAAEARDKGGESGPPFGSGHAGIRSDFMDARFRNYRLN